MSTAIAVCSSSRVSARRQIAVQIGARILTGELRAGRRLPSGRALARRLSIHRSVVAAAYRQLSAWGLVRTVPGSGVFVTRDASMPDAARSLRGFLKERREAGNPLAETAALLRRWLPAALRPSVLVVEREAALRSVLVRELRAGMDELIVAGASLGQVLREPLSASGTIVVARRGLVLPLQHVLPPWVEVLPVRFRPVDAEMLTVRAMRRPSTIAFCTRSRCVGSFARGLLASEHGDGIGLLVVDPADAVTLARAIRIAHWVFSDSECAPELLGSLRSRGAGISRVRVVRLVAPRFLAELTGYFQPSHQWEKAT